LNAQLQCKNVFHAKMEFSSVRKLTGRRNTITKPNVLHSLENTSEAMFGAVDMLSSKPQGGPIGSCENRTIDNIQIKTLGKKNVSFARRRTAHAPILPLSPRQPNILKKNYKSEQLVVLKTQKFNSDFLRRVSGE
jgi:hypothetical protein